MITSAVSEFSVYFNLALNARRKDMQGDKHYRGPDSRSTHTHTLSLSRAFVWKPSSAVSWFSVNFNLALHAQSKDMQGDKFY